ncbi:MAG: ArgE/DapE family deacylase [Deltaproteobacteria bacterium]|nr:ArgE/DapE family deacylase [Deltaproteobacteria bacterium]MBW1995274.1 ArgE/DapE family deacylase [Deltaproteobacteria bacterium]MBW2153799.1 ArgE/DapE family deacylase [Deltaproteobacteria bacterium]
MEDKILSKVEEQREQIIESLATLVKTPSRTGEEGAAQQIVEKRYREMGLDVDVWEPDVEELFEKFPEVAQYPSHWQHDLILPYQDLPNYRELVESNLSEVLNYRDRPNVVGIWKGTGGGRSLILNGHIDTVTIEPRDAWTHDPFGAEIEDGKMYGRGASDDKSGVVAALWAVRCLRDLGIVLKGDVILESVVNEEHAGNGTLACIARGYTADAAIAVESSDNRVRLCGYGGVYWGINLKGTSFHTKCRWEGDALIGVSANEKLPGVITQLLALESDKNRIPVNPFYAGKKPFSLNIGRVWGGTYDTAGAATCTLRGSIYFGPDIGSVKGVMDSVKEYIMRVTETDPWLRENPPQVEFFHHDDAHWIDPEEEIVKTVMAAGQQVFGQEPEIIAGIGANDCRHLINQGKMPSFVFGPGTGDQAHSIDESIKIEDLIAGVKVLAIAVYHWCR